MPSVWYDEAATMSAVERPWWSLAKLVHHVDLVHLTYYGTAKLWTDIFGHSVLAFRSLSALLLALTCGLGVLVAGRLIGARAASWSALWLLLLPGLTWAGFDARPSAFSCATTMLATWLLLRALESTGARPALRWLLYGVALALTIAVQVLTVLIVIPHLVLALQRRRVRPWLLTAASACLVMAPFALAADSQSGQISWLQVRITDAVPSMLWSTFALGLRRLHEPWWALLGSVLVGTTAWAMVLLGARARTRHITRALIPLWMWAFAPAALAICWSLVASPVYQERYCTWTVPAFALLIAAGCAQRPGLARATTLCAVVGALLVGVSARTPDAKYGQDYNSLARWVATLPRDTDLVVTQPGSRAAMLVHPSAFRGLRDASAIPGRGAVPTGTFWGEDEQAANVIRGLTNPRHVLLLHETRRGVDLAPLDAALRSRGCMPTSRIDVLRTGGVFYTCKAG